jgi:hypothetical protein
MRSRSFWKWQVEPSSNSPVRVVAFSGSSWLTFGIRIRLARRPYFARARVGYRRYTRRSCCRPHSVIAGALDLSLTCNHSSPAPTRTVLVCNFKRSICWPTQSETVPIPREEASTNQ